MADNNANEYSTVTLSLDDGTECECAIVRIFPAGDNNYIALLPLEGEAASNDEVYLYRYTEKDNGEPVLENIESDEEYETVPWTDCPSGEQGNEKKRSGKEI